MKPIPPQVIAKIIDQLEHDQLRWLFHFFANDSRTSILDQIRLVARKLHFHSDWKSQIPEIPVENFGPDVQVQ